MPPLPPGNQGLACAPPFDNLSLEARSRSAFFSASRHSTFDASMAAFTLFFLSSSR